MRRTDEEDPSSRVTGTCGHGRLSAWKAGTALSLHTSRPVFRKQLSWEAGRPASVERSPRPSWAARQGEGGVTAAVSHLACWRHVRGGDGSPGGGPVHARGRRGAWVSSGGCLGASLDPGGVVRRALSL